MADQDGIAARAYLESLLNQPLMVHTSDGRMFMGDFKCTDNDRNIILSRTFEYRHPTAAALTQAASEAQNKASVAAVAGPEDIAVDVKVSSHVDSPSLSSSTSGPQSPTTVKADMTSRFMGLVVVPGQHITRIEFEQSAPL